MKQLAPLICSSLQALTLHALTNFRLVFSFLLKQDACDWLVFFPIFKGRLQVVIDSTYKPYPFFDRDSRWGNDVTQTCDFSFLSPFKGRCFPSYFDAINFISFFISERKLTTFSFCKFESSQVCESSQKDESRRQSTDSSKAYRNISAFKCTFSLRRLKLVG